MSQRPLPALTGVRFFLALWVVIYHHVPPIESVLASFPALLGACEALLHTGYSAVTAFFVLSGFVLAYNYDLSRAPTPSSTRSFAIARFSRIYPAYAVGLLLLVPLALYRLSEGIEIAPPAEEWGDFLLNAALLQAWLPQAALTWNFPGWSLSNEAFFYACFPLLGFWLWRSRHTALLVLVLWGLACAAPLAAVWWPAYHWGDVPATTLILPKGMSIWANVVRYNPLLRLPEFCCGILLAKLYFAMPVSHPLQGRGYWLYLPCTLITLAVLINGTHIPYPLIHNGLLVPLYGGILLGLALGGGILARFLSTSPLLLLGNASYSLYILHAPTYQWLDIAFRRLLDRDPHGWLWFFSYLIIIIGGACVFYKLIEEPLHRALRSALTRYFAKPTTTAVYNRVNET